MNKLEEKDIWQHINTSTGIIFGAVLLLAFIYQSYRRKNMPPGPPAVPLLGSLPFLGSRDLRKAFADAREKYGDLLTVRLGLKEVVVLNSYDVIKDALVNHAYAFSGRATAMFSRNMGLVFSDGSFWREQRKFAHGVLREFGVGHNLLEQRILEELNLLSDHLLQNATKGPFNPANLFHNAVSNIICSIAFNKRFHHDDPEFQHLLKSLNELVKNARFSNNHLMQYLPGDLFGVKAFLKNAQRIYEKFQKYIDEHRLSRTPGQIRDYIDAFLEQMEVEKDNKFSTFYDEQLIFSIFHLFIAGTETTATTLKWAIVFLLHNQDMQIKVCNEIKEVLGDRLPTMKDKIKLPYTEAFILEVQRLADIVPLSLPHRTTEDVCFRGYFIPKNTVVLANLNSSHKDPEFWKDPYVFDPTHFLGADGTVEKNEHLIPFSMGRRVCLGESLARTELFLFLTGMLQRLTFKLPPGHTLPDTSGHFGTFNTPPTYEIIAIPYQ